MIAVIIIIVILSACSKHRPKPAKLPKQAPIVVYDPISPAEIQRRAKERERAERAVQQREQAASDYDRLTAQRETVLALCEAIEQELNTCTSDTRRTQLLSKLVTTENRLASIDRRRDKAYAAFAA